MVHYAHPEGAASVVHAVQELAPEPDEVVVVDNASSWPDWLLLQQLAPTATLIRAEANRGYAAAVNLGVRALPRADVIVVATHDVLLRSHDLGLLLRHLADPRVACVAPLLVLRGTERVWSAGGTLRASVLPGHLGHGDPVERWAYRQALSVQWADGAFLTYRAEILRQEPLDEEFFLYMEDVEHHRRLAALGLAVLVEPAFQAEQRPSGVPPFLYGRNSRLLQQKLRPGTQSLASGARLWAREVGAFLRGSRSARAVRLFAQGWRHPDAAMPPDWNYRDSKAD